MAGIAPPLLLAVLDFDDGQGLMALRAVIHTLDDQHRVINLDGLVPAVFTGLAFFVGDGQGAVFLQSQMDGAAAGRYDHMPDVRHVIPDIGHILLIAQLPFHVFCFQFRSPLSSKHIDDEERLYDGDDSHGRVTDFRWRLDGFHFRFDHLIEATESLLEFRLIFLGLAQIEGIDLIRHGGHDFGIMFVRVLQPVRTLPDIGPELLFFLDSVFDGLQVLLQFGRCIDNLRQVCCDFFR